MSAKTRFTRLLLFAVTCLAFITRPACAVDFVWSSFGANDNWFNFENWTPYEFGPPTTFDTATIGNGDPAYVDHDFAVNDQVNALTVSGGSDLYTNGYEAIIDNNGTATTLITGAGSLLIVAPHVSNPALDSFDTDLMTVQNGGTVQMIGGVLEVDSGLLLIGAGSVLFGAGSIDLEAVLGAATTVLGNDGVLQANNGTLDIDVTSANGRVDLDGSTGLGEVSVGTNGTLDIGAPLADTFSGTIGFGTNSHLVMSAAWTADASADVNVNAGAASTATISGGALTASGVFNVNSGTLIIEPMFNASGASVVVGGQGQDATLQLDGTATLGNLNLNDTGAGAGTPNLTVNGNTTINQAILNWDADGMNTTTVGAGGVLTLNVDQLDTTGNHFDSTINNSGQLNVNLTNPTDVWTMAGTLNMNASTGAAINPGNMNVTGTINVVSSIPAVPAATSGGVVTAGVPGATKIMGDQLTFESGSTVNINSGVGLITPEIRANFLAGSTLNVNNATARFEGDVNVDQNAALNLGVASHLVIASGTTTVDHSGAVLDVDGGGGDATLTIGQGARLIATADQFDVSNNVVNGTQNISGELEIHFTDPADTLTFAGVTNITANALPAQPIMHLEGGLNFAGTTNFVSDKGVGSAMILADRINLFGTQNLGPGVELVADSPIPVQLGGVTNFDTGVGIIVDPITLRTTGDMDINVTGVVNATGDGVAMIMGGRVTIGATSTTDVATNAKLTFHGNDIELAGGTIGGMGTVDLQGGTTTVTGNSKVSVELLVIEKPWVIHGGGHLQLDAAKVVVPDDTTAAFEGPGTINDNNILTGLINVGHGAELGFNLTSGSPTLENLNVESYWNDSNSVVDTNGGDLTVTGAINGSGTFRLSGGAVSIPGMVMPRSIPGPSPIVVNSDGPVTNDVVQYDPAGVIVVEGDMELTSTSAYEAEIGGTSLGAEYDNITIDGTATLGGELHVVLFDGFVPSPGDTFEVLTYGDHVGEFATLTGDAVFGSDGNDFFHPIYQDTRMLLYAPIGGDGNFDGVNNGLDYLIWASNYGQTDVGFGGGDYNHDGIDNGLDYLIWAGSYGQSTGGLATAVPEPGTLGLLLVGMFAWPLRRRRT
ncbi:MAG: PEP-CTERM sorting domain-containing protein [Pirellulales bacterium]